MAAAAPQQDFVPKAILLTGGAGFIGSNVVLHLIKTFPDTKVVCYDKLDYCASLNNLTEVKTHPNFFFVKGDICSPDLVNHVMFTHKIDCVMHFAAQSHVDNSFGNSFEFTRTNVLGTHVMLESAKLFKDQVKKFIHVSTDEVYGESTLEANDQSFNEQSSLNPSNPYAASKTGAEFLVRAYRTSFNLPTIITRGNNVFGPRQFPEKLIPKFINLLMRKKELPIHGDGRHRRSFIYVDDVARAFGVIVRKGEIGSIYNIGTDFEICTLDVAKKLLAEFGLGEQSAKLIKHVADRNFNDVRYHINRSRLEALGWSPQVQFDEGIKLTIDWYRKNPEHFGDIEAVLVPHPRVHGESSDVFFK